MLAMRSDECSELCARSGKAANLAAHQIDALDPPVGVVMVSAFRDIIGRMAARPSPTESIIIDLRTLSM